MTIKSKLFLLVALLLVAVAGMGTVGFVAVGMVSDKIYYLTHESSPLQVKMVNLQQGFEKAAANFTQMALTTSATELSRIRGRTDAALSEINVTAKELSRLKAGMDEKVLEDIKKTYQELSRMAGERLQSKLRLADADEQLRSGIALVVNETQKLGAVMHNLQKESYAAMERSKQSHQKANTWIKQMLVVREKLANINALLMQVSAVDNRFRLTPLKDKMKADLDAIVQIDLGTGGLGSHIKEFADKMNNGFIGEGGLLAARADILANPQDKDLKDKFEGKRRDLLKQIEALGGKVAVEIDSLELSLPRENVRMNLAIATVGLVGEIIGDSGRVAISARTIESTAKQVMLAVSPEEVNGLKTQLQDQFVTVAQDADRIKKHLISIKNQGAIATVGNMEAAFGNMQGVLLGERGVIAMVINNLATQAHSARIFSDAKKLIENHAQIGAEKTHAAEAGQEKAVEAVEKVAAMTTMILIIAGVISIVFGIIVSGWISWSINTYLKRVISGLNDSSGQVSSAAGEVSAASQQLAEGASEQAAALENTSASIEEVTSMTKQNADGAQQANLLMEESRQVVERANNSMSRMSASMHNLSAVGEEIGTIIKAIDDIAFQTNLLALNAAVEAARAGEAGMGFAVVAEEVRNLAQRAAEAAKRTGKLIEDVLQKITEGSALVSNTESGFQEVTASAKKVADLVAEIAAASREQSRGMDQISNTLGQMDQVVQKNATNAEETASASEQLNAQAWTLKDYVDQLASLIGGKKTKEAKEKPDTAG